MRVLHITTDLGDGGAQAMLYRFIASDVSNSHFVVSLKGEGKYGPKLRALGVSVITLDIDGLITGARGMARLMGALRNFDFDLIQSWMYHGDLMGSLISKIFSVPIVWGVHNTKIEFGTISLLTFFIVRVCALLSRCIPAAIITCAQASKNEHVAFGYNSAKIHVVPNGYDDSSFLPDKDARHRLRADFGIQDEQPVIGMVARFDPYKDHGNFLKSIDILSRSTTFFKVILVGKGVSEDNLALASTIKACGQDKRIILLGAREDISSVMCTFDITVLSSYSEAFPNVLCESMLCGVPCVTTNVGDAEAIVADTGWVVPARDPEKLATALRGALKEMDHKKSWQERQVRCRQSIVDRFLMNNMVLQYNRIWLEAASV